MSPAGDDPVRRALAYPYDAPAHCYLLAADGVRPLDPAAIAEAVRGRVGIVASGSNRAPARLAEKLPDLAAGERVAVTRCRLYGFDAVYSAHISRYGAVAATLQASPGTVVELAVTWLTEAQLPAMHRSEARGANYDFARLSGLRLELADGTSLSEVHAYIGRRGCLAKDGAALALAEIPAQGRCLRALTQRDVQDMIRARLAPAMDLPAFIAENVANAETRLPRTESLRRDAVPFIWEAMEVVAD